MHIILGILGAVAALSYYFFVFRKAGEAASEAVDMAQRVRGKMRRNAFRKKAEGSVLSAVEDPGTAAAVWFVKLADVDGPMNEEAKSQIIGIVRDKIGMDDAEEVVPRGVRAAVQMFEVRKVTFTSPLLWKYLETLPTLITITITPSSTPL